MGKHNYYPPQPAWQKGELSASDRQYVLKELDTVPYVRAAFRDLGDGLAVGSSRTVYNLPTNQSYPNSLDAMIASARIAVEVIRSEGIEEGLRRTSLEIRMNELPEQFEVPVLPGGVKGGMYPDTPIGYMRAENTEEGLKVSIGALEPQAQSYYSIPLN